MIFHRERCLYYSSSLTAWELVHGDHTTLSTASTMQNRWPTFAMHSRAQSSTGSWSPLTRVWGLKAARKALPDKRQSSLVLTHPPGLAITNRDFPTAPCWKSIENSLRYCT